MSLNTDTLAKFFSAGGLEEVCAEKLKKPQEDRRFTVLDDSSEFGNRSQRRSRSSLGVSQRLPRRHYVPAQPPTLARELRVAHMVAFTSPLYRAPAAGTPGVYRTPLEGAEPGALFLVTPPKLLAAACAYACGNPLPPVVVLCEAPEK